jgi:16S rRNA processing protein RimM
VIVGRVAGAHGVRGELRVEVLGEGPELLLGAERVALSRRGPDDPSPHWTERVGGGTGRAGEVRLALRGVADRDAAEAWRGALVLREAAELPRLPEGQHYWYELVGCRVETRAGERVGEVEEVFRTGPQDVLAIRGDDGRQRLVPAVRALIHELDVGGRRIVLAEVPGLVDPV